MGREGRPARVVRSAYAAALDQSVTITCWALIGMSSSGLGVPGRVASEPDESSESAPYKSFQTD